MSINFDIPSDVEQTLRQRHPDLNRDAKETLLVEFYRRGDLTHHQLALALGIDRYETDGVLKRHGISYELTHSELERQLLSLRSRSVR